MTGREFLLRVSGTSLVVSVATVLLVSGYLAVLLQLPPEQWRGFGEIVGVLFVLLFTAVTAINHRLIAPIMKHLDGDPGADAAQAFRSLSRLPAAMFLSGLTWWTLGGLLVASGMMLRFPGFRGFSFAVMVFAAATGGFATTIFMYFMLKHSFSSLLRTIALQLPDLALRRELTLRVSLRTKLLVSITGVTSVLVLFALFLAVVRAVRPLEENLSDLQGRYLEELALAGAVPDLQAAEERGRRLGILDRLFAVDLGERPGTRGGEAFLSPEELSALARSPEAGDGRSFDSPHVLAWRRAQSSDGAASQLVWVAARDWDSLQQDGLGLVFAVVGLVAAAMAFALSHVLARDVAGASEEIRGAAERLAMGDLRSAEPFESEDELGDLGRSFEHMVAQLRTTVRRVAGSADRVEVAAGEIAGLSVGVSRAAEAQKQGVEQAADSMERIGGQAADIGRSAAELGELVDDSSSSILELGAAGSQLDSTASLLSTKVDEVGAQVEQMVRSVRDVGSTTRTLTEAAGDTTSRMQHVARAMSSIDEAASESAQLSERAVQAAEQGKAKVAETIEGMDSIRSATETAHDVIQNLGLRAAEIGKVLDVIDEVADETNLLALNAAIIAAQAGEQGRAFSVVAGEIKELAERVLASTKEIGALIGAVQGESERAVRAIEVGSESVARGVARSREAGDSLEEITGASRFSGARVDEIVAAVQEQTRAASFVFEMMEQVNGSVEKIRNATLDQERGNQVVHGSAMAMRDVARQLQGTTAEQAQGQARIGESIEGIRDAVEAIHAAIQAHSRSSGEVLQFLGEVGQRAAANESSASRMGEGTRTLAEQVESLRSEVRRFQL